MNTSKFFFVYGSGRSGTSLFCSRLNNHSELQVPDESHFPAFAAELLSGRDIRQDDYRLLADIFELTSAKETWGLSREDIEKIFRTANPVDLPSALACLLDEFGLRSGKNLSAYGIKRPMMIFFLEKVRLTYPDSKIVHVVRDGRDVYLSYKEVHQREGISFGPKNIISGAIYWQLGLIRCRQYEEGTNSIVVRYEDFLEAPDQILQDTCSFLGVRDESEEMVESQSFRNSGNLIRAKANAAHHQNLEKKIIKDNKSRWRNELSWLNCCIFEVFAYSGLRKYGYEVKGGIFAGFLHVLMAKPTLFVSQKLNEKRHHGRFAKWSRKLERQSQAESC